MQSPIFTPTKPLLIIGAGITGLTLAQGCSRAVIPFQIFEKRSAAPERGQGWGLSLHWSLKALERTIGPELSARLDETHVDPSVEQSEGGFLFLNGATLEPRYNVKQRTKYLRCGRQKLINLLRTGLDIQYEKTFNSFEIQGDEVIAKFADGSEVRGGMLVGADGNNSLVRKALLGEDGNLNPLPVNLIGTVRRFSAEQAVPVRKLNPLLFFSLQPKTNTFFVFGVQDVISHADGTKSYDALVGVSWLSKNREKDDIPSTSSERIAEMKKRAQGFAEPLLSMIMDIPPDSVATGLPLGDFPCSPWNNQSGLVTLIGDAAHAMTMYRGEGANHGILDAALLVDQLKVINSGVAGLLAGVEVFETEMQPRGKEAVLKSRQAALDAHNWESVHDGSPLIGSRMPPASA